jgi:AbrB family looped-hinge helix DNA binding protein
VQGEYLSAEWNTDIEAPPRTWATRFTPDCWTFLTSFLTLHTMKATVTSKGQITIPLAIRRKLKLHKGTVLEFDEDADHLKATKSVDVDRMRAVIGIARDKLAGKTVKGWLEELRGPVRLPPRRRPR